MKPEFKQQFHLALVEEILRDRRNKIDKITLLSMSLEELKVELDMLILG